MINSWITILKYQVLQENNHIDEQFNNNLEWINLVYSITKLKEQVYYLLEKDPEYMSKSKHVKNSFFDSNYFEKSSQGKQTNKVLPELNLLKSNLKESWKDNEGEDLRRSRKDLNLRRLRQFIYQESPEHNDEEEE